MKLIATYLAILLSSSSVSSFQARNPARTRRTRWTRTEIDYKHTSYAADNTSSEPRQDNKAMAFLRKIGKVGGAANMDFSANALGVDEGPVGKTTPSDSSTDLPVRKAKSSYTSVEVDGMIDDLSEPFPITSSGTQWTGFTDQVMGGRSSGSITREIMDGQLANVLRGKVSMANDGGFVQMSTDLAVNPSLSRTVDMSNFEGVEFNALYKGSEEKEEFKVILKNEDCKRQFSSYRGSFTLPRGEWTYVRLPWSEFQGSGPGAEDVDLDVTTLQRIGVVALGREMDVTLGVSGLGFYSSTF